MRLLQLQLLLFFTATLSAQSLEILTLLRTTPASMSVRSAAMGAVSDDDVSANPTALASLDKALFSVAGARTSYEVRQTLVFQDNTFHDIVHGLERDALSHAMAAVPLRNGVVVSAYYRREPALRGVFPLATAGTADYVAPDCGATCGFYVFTFAPALERRDVRYGATASWERGAIALGVGAELQQFEERLDVLSFRPVTRIEDAGQYDRVSLRTSGSEVVPNAGIRWRATPRITLAAAYNGAGTFRRTAHACMVRELVTTQCSTKHQLIATSEQPMADAVRASVSIAAGERVRLVGEAVRRNYGKLGAPFTDVTELHAGAEYRVNGLAVRAGWWRDPSHTDSSTFYPYHPLGESHEHLTFGAGIDVGPARIDVAYDNAPSPALRRATVGVTFNAR